MVDVLQRRAGLFELAGRLQRHRRAGAQQCDGASLLVDPVPAEARQPPQQRLDAALAVELRRTQVFQAETELLVLGTDAPVGPGLLAGSDVPDQLVAARDGRIAGVAGTRSEEHTSELQSLLRISYAVFCLKKKKATKTDIYYVE